MKDLAELNVKLFADGADMATMRQLYSNPRIQGFTTNPTLMRKAGITNYESFAREVLECIPDRPLSLEVFADDFGEMERQARRLAKLGENVYVKIPIMNTEGKSSRDLICRLAHSGIKVNATALLTLEQVMEVAGVMGGGPPCYISVFAGRIADTGRDPIPMMSAAVEIMRPHSNLELIWASPREVLNVFQADQIGCHVITATSEILKKLDLYAKDLHQYSRETVQMFYEDACRSAYTL
jgi:transaldolase